MDADRFSRLHPTSPIPCSLNSQKKSNHKCQLTFLLNIFEKLSLGPLRDVPFVIEQGEEPGIPSIALTVGITRSIFLLSFDTKPYITEGQYFCSGRAPC